VRAPTRKAPLRPSGHEALFCARGAGSWNAAMLY